ncbi:MAG: hypothetical protein JSV00_02010 [bacterium]|nr:MAG: hypothetical protein JSV00_02010 [bacterium]
MVPLTERIVPLAVSAIVFGIGIVFALFPRWGMGLVSRCARSYMRADLASDPLYVLSFRFYGVAAAGLGLYALWQVL